MRFDVLLGMTNKLSDFRGIEAKAFQATSSQPVILFDANACAELFVIEAWLDSKKIPDAQEIIPLWVQPRSEEHTSELQSH